MWGLALDNIREITLVKADGSVTTVSANSDADLFWAMRGAGSSFAIATEYKVKTYVAPSEATFHTYTYKLNTSESATKAFLNYQNWAASNLPAELGAQVRGIAHRDR